MMSPSKTESRFARFAFSEFFGCLTPSEVAQVLCGILLRSPTPQLKKAEDLTGSRHGTLGEDWSRRAMHFMQCTRNPRSRLLRL